MAFYYYPQLQNEKLHTYWNRVQSYIASCGYYANCGIVCDTVFNGVTNETRALIEQNCGGLLFNLSNEQRWNLLLYLVRKSWESEMRWVAMMNEIKSDFKQIVDAWNEILKKSDISYELEPVLDPPSLNVNVTNDFVLSVWDDEHFFDDDYTLTISSEYSPIFLEVEKASMDILDDTVECSSSGSPTKDPQETLMWYEKCAGQYNTWDAEIDALEAALYKTEKKEVKENVCELVGISYKGDVSESEVDTYSPYLENTSFDQLAYIFQNVCYDFFRLQIFISRSLDMLAHIAVYQVLNTTIKLYDTCIQFSMDKGRPPEKFDVAFIDNIFLVRNFKGCPSLYAIYRFYVSSSNNGCVACRPSHKNWHKIYDKFLRSLNVIFDRYILSWCYLCFCVAHAQIFDKLMRALSCFDDPAHPVLEVDTC